MKNPITYFQSLPHRVRFYVMMIGLFISFLVAIPVATAFFAPPPPVEKLPEMRPLLLQEQLDAYISKERIAQARKYGTPLRLTIPSANIDAPVEYVGVTNNGAMAVPSDPTKAGWYKYGAFPGQIGSAVIAAHSGWRGLKVPFTNLEQVEVGDIVTVSSTSDKPLTHTYKVYKTELFTADTKVDEVFGKKDKAYLNLITCTGSWNAAKRTHNQRLIVFCELVK